MKRRILERDAVIAGLVATFTLFMGEDLLSVLPLWLFVTMAAWILIVGTDPAFDLLKAKGD